MIIYCSLFWRFKYNTNFCCARIILWGTFQKQRSGISTRQVYQYLHIKGRHTDYKNVRCSIWKMRYFQIYCKQFKFKIRKNNMFDNIYAIPCGTLGNPRRGVTHHSSQNPLYSAESFCSYRTVPILRVWGNLKSRKMSSVTTNSYRNVSARLDAVRLPY